MRDRMSRSLNKYITDSYNKVHITAPFISFYWMQVLRFIYTVLLVVLWCLTIYILLRIGVLYLNVWSITFSLIAFLLLFLSSGRQVVEHELEKRGEEL